MSFKRHYRPVARLWLRAGLVILTLCCGLQLAACASTAYYAQAASGQMAVLRARQPIADLIAAPGTDAVLKTRLQRLSAARDWAVQGLQLPDNGSYRSYADVHRPYVLWNVFATPALSLAPVEHCFLLVGCLAYRGYYDERAAQAQAAQLSAAGNDTDVGGVPAYSTLGWFDDPVLSTMLRWDDATLIETLFHELAHQKLFVAGDTAFNEAYAEFVGEQGLRQYRALHPELPDIDAAARRRQQQFTQLVLDTRAQLAALYAAQLPEPLTRQLKAETLAGLQARYALLRDSQWNGSRAYERWFAEAPLNNARLLPFGLYDEAVPAFAALFAECDGDWRCFHAAAARIAALKPAARRGELQRLQATAAP